ncbi:MAG: 3-methyl-2-oxobutanoate hydroxymethyltransferase [Deltaproteobacteria bacterium]|nr:3-methyl-2-oxobutanoate hydroxymethyltransferase [Deltaproteobacteria bacterium]
MAEAGAFSMCVEGLPCLVAKKIPGTFKVPTQGIIGAGPHCDCQELTPYDLGGLFGDFKPKLVKH